MDYVLCRGATLHIQTGHFSVLCNVERILQLMMVSLEHALYVSMSIIILWLRISRFFVDFLGLGFFSSAVGYGKILVLSSEPRENQRLGVEGTMYSGRKR